ncbi:MAG TPA: endonuclease/exonuclease/phosphatase family protein [Vicinamibacterales bacterium]|nr:endonuclease/exonuclease/phosphatase family protein [Vicinamibacterales bacterium]
MLISSAVVLVVAAAILSTHRAIGADARTLRVMTFNVQHGIGGSHKYDLQRAIDVIAKIQPDIVGLQEVTRNHPYYNCDDQPAKIAAGLRSATGRAWAVAYEQEWFTPNVECRDSGRGDGKETEGLAFLAPGDTLGPTTTTPLPVSRIALAVKLPSAGGLPIAVTHLASGKQNGDARRKEIDVLLRWMEKLGPTSILLGDFNAKPEDEVMKPVFALFRDGGQAPTHGDSRIDYVLYRGGLTLQKVEAVDTAPLFGTAASDHKPVVATFNR